jgi:beta-phosphoglucomutase-like phosphatase (HAD superfamily)
VRIDAVAWDIDGTLIDSEPLHHQALLDASASFGVDLKDLPPLAFRGVHMDEVWSSLRDRFPATLARAEWLDGIERRYIACADRLRSAEGAKKAIELLHREGFPQVCVSNSSRRIVDANLRALGVLPCLRFSISLDDVAHGKPDPEPYAVAAARLGIEPPRLLAVEDSASGVSSARSAGLRTAAIGNTSELEADWLINSVMEVADIVLARARPLPAATARTGGSS